MPNSIEYLEGYRLKLLILWTINFFKDVIEKSEDDYLCDKSSNFILSSFYKYKHSLERNYVNILTNGCFNTDEKIRLGIYFEEKDKRSLSSKERNKISHLLSIKKWNLLELDDLFKESAFEFELQNKNCYLEIKGLNMMKLDYSSIPCSQAQLSVSFKSFLKTSLGGK